MSVHELGFDSVWVHSGYFDIIQQHRALGRGHHGGGARLGWGMRCRSQTGCVSLTELVVSAVQLYILGEAHAVLTLSATFIISIAIVRPSS